MASYNQMLYVDGDPQPRQVIYGNENLDFKPTVLCGHIQTWRKVWKQIQAENPELVLNTDKLPAIPAAKPASNVLVWILAVRQGGGTCAWFPYTVV